ncbi:uncharacterized [Tachysurus ichikawai]
MEKNVEKDVVETVEDEDVVELDEKVEEKEDIVEMEEEEMESAQALFHIFSTSSTLPRYLQHQLNVTSVSSAPAQRYLGVISPTAIPPQ